MRKTLFATTLLVCALTACAAATVRSIDNFRNADGTPLIVPKPQRYETRTGVFQLPETLTVEAPASEKIVFEYLGQELKRFSCKVVPGEAAAQCRFVLTSDGVPENKEGYTLEITPDGVCVKARTTDGLFYGAVTLCNLLRNAERPELDCCSIADWPTMPYRGYGITVQHVRSGKLGSLKPLVDTLARFKFNSLSIGLGESFPYRSEHFAKAKNVHTREDLEEFRDYCRARHIRIRPGLQVLSHNYWLTFHSDWDKMKEGDPGRMWDSQPCIRNEEARRITMNCLREQIEFFDPEVMNVGMDEIVQCPFRKCPRCRNVPAMELLSDYMKFLREGLKDFKGRLLFCNDSFYTGRNPNWPWGDEFRKLLDPERDIIGYWGYGNQLKEEGISPFKDFVTFGTCLTGKPLNARNMTAMILKYRGEGVTLTHWYYSRSGSCTSLKSETPESLGGLPQGAEYFWNFRDVYYGDLAYDGVYEMLRTLRPRMVNDAAVREEATALPLDRAVNAELSKSGIFPELDDDRIAELKAILAKRPERFDLLSSPGGRYYGMRVSGDKRDGGRRGIQFNAFGRKFRTLSLLMTASRPYNLGDYLSYPDYGPKRFQTSTGATLTFEYADGQKKKVPLRYRADFTDWNQIQGGVNMRFAVRGVDLKNRYYSFGVCDIANPRPDAAVKHITFSTNCLDGISPVILAASLKGADKPVGATKKFDPAKLALYPVSAPPESKLEPRYDFKRGMPDELRIAPLGKFSGEVKTEIVDDPERGKVLKITVPPATQRHAEGYVRINVTVPFKYDGKMKGVYLRVRLAAAPGEFVRAMEYLQTRRLDDAPGSSGNKFRAYMLRGVRPQWSALCSRYNRKPAESNLKDLGEAKTLRVCFYFKRITTPAEIYISDIGEIAESYDRVPEWGPGQERD